MGKSTILRTIPLNPYSPSKPWQSKLSPYAKEIATWRKEMPPRTYAAISVLLAKKYGLKAHPDTIHSFVKVRSKHSSNRAFKILPKFLREVEGADAPPKSSGSAEIRIVDTSYLPPPQSYPVVNPNKL